jgi:hypothetical protein
MLQKYIFYLFRWQLSTPILAIVLIALHGIFNDWIITVIANFIGGLIFFWVDRLIFKVEYHFPLWEIKEQVRCADCGEECRGYRLVKTSNYDRLNDKEPEFRCAACSQEKTKKLKKAGVQIPAG